MIVAIIPAHNEQDGIVQTIQSLRGQSVPPDYIIVVADNCSDETVPLSEQAGAIVFHTKDNSNKKAGALNQILEFVVPHISDEDFLLPVDADSILCEDWIESALTLLDDTVGAVSGAYVARRGKGFVTLLQRAEYAQERRRISRRNGLVDVLSGTAVMIPASILRRLHSERGFFYDEKSLTEDFEITIAIRSLGYQPRCFKELKVVTDVMETWKDLYRQRLRWQRGTIETLSGYGWNKLTRRLWITNGLTYMSSLVIPVIVISWTFAIITGGGISILWLLAMPVFVTEQFISSRKAGVVPALTAASLIPMWVYDAFRVSVYWIALHKSFKKAAAEWN